MRKMQSLHCKNQGFTGDKLPPEGLALRSPIIFEYSCLSGDVVHIKGNVNAPINLLS